VWTGGWKLGYDDKGDVRISDDDRMNLLGSGRDELDDLGILPFLKIGVRIAF
jgi:hypothetical protein